MRCPRITTRRSIHPSIRALAAVLLVSHAACVGAVGGGGSGRDRDDDDDDDDRGDGTCEKIHDPVTVRSQADLDELPEGCWDLYATLTIQGSAITSLAELGELEAVNDLVIEGTALTAIDTPKTLRAFGAVTIKSNAQLASLANLEVDSPDGLVIENNAVLASLDKVADVGEIGGGLTINANPRLAAVALPNLTRVGESVRILNNNALTSIDITKVNEVKSIEVTNNILLTSFMGLYATQIDGDFTLRGNKALATLGTMASLETVTGSIVIDDNDALTRLDFGTALQYVTAYVTISNNQRLADIGQFSRMQAIGAITITSNPALSFCRAQEVDHCVVQHGAVTIQNNMNGNNCQCWCH